jgi:hypothetical protein
MVDVIFPDTLPQAAMEVTSIVDDEFASTANAARKAVERRLRAVAETTGLPLRWTFQIVSGAHVNALEELMTDLILTGQAPGGRDIAPGLIRVDTEASDVPGAEIATWSSRTAGALYGFGPELIRAINSKKSKLGKAEGYERHLAVDVLALRSSDPGRTPCPELPDEIDFVWVTRRAFSLLRGSPVVWVSDGHGSWRVNGSPHEAL